MINRSQKFYKYNALVLLLLMSSLAWPQPPKPIAKSVENQTPGYYFILPYKISDRFGSRPSYAMILNELGELVYYRVLTSGGDFKMHTNGLYSYLFRSTFYILNKNFDLIDSVNCVNGRETDAHDFLILSNGHYLLLGTESIPANCSNKSVFLQSNKPGSKYAKIRYGVIQELDAEKKMVYEWRSAPWFLIEKADLFHLNDTLNVDLTHFNSIDVDDEGNFLISARNYNEVFKVERKTGKIMWHFGGKNNDIKILNDTLPFYGQHDARFTGKNRFSLFDNGYTAPEKKHTVRALEYEINDHTKTAKLVWNYTEKPVLVSKGTGNARKLAKERMLVNYGQIEGSSSSLMFAVVDTTGQKHFSVCFSDTLASYRAYFYDKRDVPIPQVKLRKILKGKNTLLQPESDYKYYKWVNGEKNRSIIITKAGDYYVYVSNDNVSFIRSEKYVLH